MIDNTNIIIDVCEEVGAKSDDAGSEKMLYDTEFHDKLTKSSEELVVYAEKTWKEFFKEKKFQ